MNKIANLKHELATYFPDDDFTGMTIRNIFHAIDHPPIIIFWKCWTDAELNSTLN